MTHTQTTCPNCITLREGKKGANPTGVGALAPVFEKSAIELKQQTLLKFNHTVQIATFNVRTLNRIGQLQELTASAIEHKILDIICIQEHRYTHSEDIKYHDTGISMEKLYQCHNRRSRYAYRTTSPKNTK